MKITKQQLRKLIQETVARAIKEWDDEEDAYGMYAPMSKSSKKDQEIAEIMYLYKELYGKDAPDSFLDKLDKLPEKKFYMLLSSMSKELERKDMRDNKKYGRYREI